MVWEFVNNCLNFEFQLLLFSPEGPKYVTNFISYPVPINATRILVGNISWRSSGLLV